MTDQKIQAEWHPEVEQLHAFAAGRLDDQQLQHELEEHLRTCNACLIQTEQAGMGELEFRLRNLHEIENLIEPLPERYELIEEIGRGGSGIVYRAKHAGLDREIAFKMLLRGDRSSRAEYSRFRRESVALARLSHPNIVQIYDCGEIDGAPFIAMELVAGVTLAERLQIGPLEPQLAAQWICSLADAIALAHEKRIFHRDLKPQNVLLAPVGSGNWTDSRQRSSKFSGSDQHQNSFQHQKLKSPKLYSPSSRNDSLWTPKLVDFGLAVCQDSTIFETATGETLGTPTYMAPEAIGGRIKSGSEESLDIYGLGVILYACLTGRPPFTGSSTWEILEAVANREPVSISSLRSGVPRDLITICNRCMDKRPERRFATARELADDLQRFIEGVPIRSRRVSSLEKTWRWARRRPAAAIACMLGLVLAVTIPLMLAYQNWSVQQERNLARTQYAAVRATLHEVLAELNRNTGTVIPEATQLAARQVAHARQMFEQLAEVDRSPQSDFDLGKVLIQSAKIENLLGQNQQAYFFLDQAEARFRGHPTSDIYRVEALQGLFQIYIVRSTLLQNARQMDDAEANLDAAATIFESLEQLHHETGAPNEVELLSERQLLLQNRGTLALRQSKYEHAADFYQQSLDVFAQFSEQQAESPDHLFARAGLRINLAAVEMLMQQNEAAELNYRQALEELEAWAETNARTSKWIEDWSVAVLNRSNLLNALERKEEAFLSLDRARPVLRQAAENDPGRVELRNLLFMISANRGLFCQDEERKIEVWRDAVADASDRAHLIYAQQILVRVMASQGQPLEALEVLSQISTKDMTDQEIFVQASCHALIGKHLSEFGESDDPDTIGKQIQKSVQESWRLLRQLAEQGQLNEVRLEHLNTADDWSTIRQNVGETEWEQLRAYPKRGQTLSGEDTKSR